MRHTKTVVAWLSVVLAACAAAPAAITTTFVQIPISPAAIASDPALAGYQSWDVRVNVSGASEWGFSGMTAQLTRGLFYNPALGADFPVPTLWGAFPHVRYDTFVTQAANPNDDSTFIPPQQTSAFPGPPVEPPRPPVFNDTTVSVNWHVLPSYHITNGVYTIARLTFPHGAVGTIVGNTFDRFDNSVTPFSFAIPEPASGAVVATATIALLAGRRRARGCR